MRRREALRVALTVACAFLLGATLPQVVHSFGGSNSTGAFTAAQVRNAYGLGGLWWHGFRGQGTTVVVPALFARSVTAVTRDFQAFSRQNGLRTGGLEFRYFGTNGADLNSSGLNAGSGWGAEQTFDAEDVHAIAPGATVVLLLAPNDTELYRGISQAINESWGTVFSFSQTITDGIPAVRDGAYVLNASLELAAERGINFFASSGDCGAYQNSSTFTTGYPASSPWVVSVGGTVLRTTPTGRWLGEYGWNGTGSGLCVNQGGSGGGIGPLGNEEPIVSALAGSWLRMVYGGYTYSSGGTSLSAPVWAGIVADIQSALHRPIGWLPPLFAAICASATLYREAFHDVTQGFNGYDATPGRDLVTGYGSPDAAGLLRALRVL